MFENEEGMKWISVKDELPKHKEMVLLYAIADDRRISYKRKIIIGKLDTNKVDKDIFRAAHGNYRLNVTHWMELLGKPKLYNVKGEE